jgi:hypothetical protein
MSLDAGRKRIGYGMHEQAVLAQRLAMIRNIQHGRVHAISHRLQATDGLRQQMIGE